MLNSKLFYKFDSFELKPDGEGTQIYTKNVRMNKNVRIIKRHVAVVPVNEAFYSSVQQKSSY